MKKKKTLAVVLLVLLGLFWHWFFPYSILSSGKLYTINGDNITIGEYEKDLKEFKKDLRAQKKRDELTTYLYTALNISSQDWLTTKGDALMYYDQLEDMESKARLLKEELIQFDTTPLKLSPENQDSFRNIVASYAQIEKMAGYIHDNNNMARPTLKTMLWNLRVEYGSNLDLVKSFYHNYQEDLSKSKEG